MAAARAVAVPGGGNAFGTAVPLATFSSSTSLADEAGLYDGSSKGSWVAGSEFSSHSYEPAAQRHCRRLRKLRDAIVESPGCLGCTICLAASAVGFFCLEAWWYAVMYWPGHMEAAVVAAPVVLQRRFQRLGCYPVTLGDSGAPPPGTWSETMYDESCMPRMPEGQLCRSGLPWYSFQLGDGSTPSWRLCAEFCLLKGLDVSGAVDGGECRCGASPALAEEIAAGRPDLAWQAPEARVADDSEQCRIVAAQYLGRVPLPENELDVSSVDLAYVESVARGLDVDLDTNDILVPPVAGDLESSEDLNVSTGDGNSSQDLQPNSPEEPQQFEDDDGQMVLRQCFPQQCAAGLAWPIWTTYVSGIPYAFHGSVGEATRQAFRQAVAAYHAATCVLLSEVSPSYSYSLKILVTSTSAGCWTRPLGYPVVYHRDTEINLGWCNGEREVGNMIHELGHALGMAHEQTRPDRDQYVSINAENLTATGKKQYVIDVKAYTGSKQGGYEPYDYGSLMHYPANSVLHTLPIVHGRGVHDGEVGQRQGLSRLDVRQLRTMYNCDAADSWENACVDIDDGLGEALNFRGVPASCAQVAPKYCDHYKYGQMIMYFCRSSCNNCPKPPSGSGQGAHAPTGIEGCQDASPFCEPYEAYCPGASLQGNEQWMSQHCRATCHIERYCGPSVENEPDDGIAPAPAAPCMDSDDTGLLNVLGKQVSCSQLVGRCWDGDIGGQVRSACPASCGQCADMEDQAPEKGTASVRLVFEVGGGAFDLSDPSDRSTLEETLSSQLSLLYGHDLEASISSDDASCGPPCREGTATMEGDCCVQATYMGSCTVTCADLAITLERYDAPVLTAKLLSMGLAGIVVKRVEEPRWMTGVLAKVFMTPRLKFAVFGLGVASIVCMLFACSACPACRLRGQSSPLHGVLLEGETDSDDA